MAVHKNKKTGAFEVFCYDPRKGRMVYVGTRPLERDAKKLFRQKTDELATEAPRFVTFDAYAETWLELHHGPGTRRPAASTRAHNEQMLRAFLTDFGTRKLDGITAARHSRGPARIRTTRKRSRRSSMTRSMMRRAPRIRSATAGRNNPADGRTSTRSLRMRSTASLTAP
jgi:hypothetical protein